MKKSFRRAVNRSFRLLFGVTPFELRLLGAIAEESAKPVSGVRARTHDVAPTGLDPDLLATLDSDDPVVRAAAVDKIEKQVGASEMVETQDDEIIIEESRPLLPDGNHRGMFVRHETRMSFGRPKVLLWFVVGSQEMFGAFPVARIIERNRFVLHPGQRLALTLMRLSDRLRLDRPTLRMLRGKPLVVTTRTVRIARDRRPLPRPYSVIEDFDAD